MIKLFLIRGLPGSGKSTKAKMFKTLGIVDVVFEADDYFGFGENYNFNPILLGKAHQSCLDNTKEALEQDLNVAVANTFTTLKELQPYIDLGYKYKIIECTGHYKSVHNVPETTIDRMRTRWYTL